MATFTTAKVTLARRSGSSYQLEAGSLDDLAAHLEGLQFWREPPRSPHEYARYRSGRGALVVLYHTGTVLVQGQQQQQTHGQLARLVTESEGLL
jgi:ribonuclease HIII